MLNLTIGYTEPGSGNIEYKVIVKRLVRYAKKDGTIENAVLEVKLWK